MKNKINLRNWAKDQRKSLYSKLQNETILKKIKELSTFNNACNIMIYYPLDNEINLLPLLNKKKNFCFPVIINNEIIPYKNNFEFNTGKYNIKEPKNSTPQSIEEIDLIIAPALCVDINGNRLGYGKGYYDKFIKKLNRNKTKILVGILDEFVVKEIDADIFDEKIDFIVTEKRVIEF